MKNIPIGFFVNLQLPASRPGLLRSTLSSAFHHALKGGLGVVQWVNTCYQPADFISRIGLGQAWQGLLFSSMNVVQ
ncbi:MAG: hypothetical protein P9M14_15370 [Candidatus Alcyoniella australis]|nr:hypothetical protein [Candidatus Alcyoniella australis]